MKNILYPVLAIFLAFVCAACSKQDSAPSLDISGEWHLVSAGDLPMASIDVYVSFGKGTFDLYQMLGEGRYRHYGGTYSVQGDVMTGQSSDGEPLGGGSYTVSLESDNSTLTLIPQNDPDEISVYEHAVIPNEVIGNAIETKSLIDNERRML